MNTPRLALIAAAVLGTSTAWAAGMAPSDAQSRYQQERAACINGQSHQDRATCLKEAGAALSEARRGHLDDRNTDYQRNATQRCNALPADDREACMARMRGEGSTTGSVEQGAIVREYHQIVPAESMPQEQQDQQKEYSAPSPAMPPSR
jgi:hypothetical protein